MVAGLPFGGPSDFIENIDGEDMFNEPNISAEWEKDPEWQAMNLGEFYIDPNAFVESGEVHKWSYYAEVDDHNYCVDLGRAKRRGVMLMFRLILKERGEDPS